MEQLTQPEIDRLTVKRMATKSLVFNLDGRELFATKTVANKILNHTAKHVFVEEISRNNTKRAWLCVPSICFDRIPNF